MEPMSSHVLATETARYVFCFFNKCLMSTGVCDLFSLENVYKQPTEYLRPLAPPQPKPRTLRAVAP